VTVNLTTFEPKWRKQQACKAKAQKPGLLCSGVEVWEQEQNALETAPVGLQEGAGGLSFTVLCFSKGMHRSPSVRDNHTAAVLYEKKTIGRDENLFIVSVKQLKLMWSQSGLKASLEAQILTAFL